MRILSYLGTHKLYTAGISLVLAALLGIGIAFGDPRTNQPVQTITSETAYVTRQREDVRKIASRYGLPPSVIMADNNLKSFQINQDQKLVIKPVTDFRRIPDGIGSQIYGRIRPSLIYEDAFVFPDEKNTLKTVVLFSSTSSTNTEIGGGGHELVYGVRKQIVTKTFSNLNFVVLDQGDRKFFEYPFSLRNFGRDNTLYPLGYAQNDKFRFILHSKIPKDWFPWQLHDIEKTVTFEIQPGKEKDKNTYIDTVRDAFIEGRNVRIGDVNGDGLIEVVGTYFGSDNLVIMRGPKDTAIKKGVVIKRLQFSKGDIVEGTTRETVLGELIRLFSSSELTADDLLLIAESDPEINGSNIRKSDINEAARILETARKRQFELVGAVGTSVSSNTDYVPKVASILGVQDPYITRQIAYHAVSPYLFSANEKGEVKPFMIELYDQEREIYGVIPTRIHLIGILDGNTRQLAAQGKVSLGRDGALEINLGATKTIGGEVQPVSTNFSIVPRKEVAEKTRATYEKARKGELPVSEALQLTAEFVDLTIPITTVADTINTASNAVDFLRAQGYNNIGDVLRDVKKLSSGDLQQIRQIPGFLDMMGYLLDGAKK